MIDVMNAKSMEYMASNGTVFKSSRCDLKGLVKVSSSFDISDELKFSDFAQFGAWHLHNIHPNLHGFSGYDCVRYEFDDGAG